MKSSAPIIQEVKKRGRKKGSIDRPTIKDPLLHPFFIQIEESSFTVFKENDPVAFGYYVSLAVALERIVKFKLALGEEKNFSLSEYISQYIQSTNKFITTIKL